MPRTRTPHLKIEYIAVGALKPAAYHPRQISEDELARLERSIQEFGFADPVIVRRVGLEVIGGHHRRGETHRTGDRPCRLPRRFAQTGQALESRSQQDQRHVG